MADMGLGNINWDEVDENSVGEFAPVPDGYYLVVGTKSEMKPTKAGPQAANLTWTIQQGEYKGRLLFDQFNLHNPNQVARNIALASMKKACIAMGKSPTSDTEQFLHTPLYVKVAVVPPETRNGKTYAAKNEVKDYMSYDQYQERMRREQNASGSQGGHESNQQHQQQGQHQPNPGQQHPPQQGQQSHPNGYQDPNGYQQGHPNGYQQQPQQSQQGGGGFAWDE